MQTRLGIEALSSIDGRVGLLTHPAAVLPDLRHSLDALVERGAQLSAVFGAEHGFRGTAQAGDSEAATIDVATGLPVYDTYAHSVEELSTMLTASGTEVLLVDLQHVGARFYTYESTLYDAIAAAAIAGVRVIVTDRPNPIGGEVVDGPVLQASYASFVGRAPIAMRHGLTMGELGLLFADLLNAPAPDVVPMEGWSRGDRFEHTGLPWVPPSPNIPTASTAHVYAGTCLFEGTNLSIGRGTTTPFEVIGAPWLDGRLAGHLRSLDLPGTGFREIEFTPAFNDHAGVHLRGVAVHITDPDTFDPVRTALSMLTSIEHLYPGVMAFRPTIDKLAGTDALRLAIEAGAHPEDIVASWRDDLTAFADLRSGYLLY